MSIKSVDDFDPTTSIPVFGGTVSQTKLQEQQKPINDLEVKEILMTPVHPSPNADKIESAVTDDRGSNEIPLNGQDTKLPMEIHSVESKSKSTLSTEAPATLPSLSADQLEAAKQDMSSVSASVVDAVPSTDRNDTTTAEPVLNTPENKGQSLRGKGKSPVISTPPTRQSSRGKKSVSSIDNEDKSVTNTVPPVTNSQTESSPMTKRAKRPTSVKEPPSEDASHISTLDAKATKSVDHQTVPSVSTSIEESKETISNTVTSTTLENTPGSATLSQKREASSSPTVSPAKKSKGASKDEKTPPIVADVETPKKEGRSNATRKTPISTPVTPESSEEYVRKLRPRK